MKRKLKRKEQTPHSIRIDNGRVIEKREEILEEYENYYKKLLKTRPPDNAEETVIEKAA